MLPRFGFALVVVVAAGCLSGCKQRKVTCEDALRRANAVLDREEKSTAELRAGRLTEAIRQCESDSTSPEVLRCLMDAATKDEVVACEKLRRR